jgi:hypothetical protein
MNTPLVPQPGTGYHGVVTHPSRRLALVVDAIEVVSRRLSALPASREVEALRARATECRRETDTWRTSPPAAAERDKLMKRVLNLHVEVAKLERDG